MLPLVEYRVLSQDGKRPFPHVEFSCRSDEGMWQTWKGEKHEDQIVDATGYEGVEGILEVTRLEALAKGAKAAWIERRRVEDWEKVENDA